MEFYVMEVSMVKRTISISIDADLLEFWDKQLAGGTRRSTWLRLLLKTWYRTGISPLQFGTDSPLIPVNEVELQDQEAMPLGPDGYPIPEVPSVAQPQYLNRRWKQDIAAWVVTYRIEEKLQFAAIFSRADEMWVYRVEKRAATAARDGTPTRLFGACEGRPFAEYTRIGALTNDEKSY
jgi:hypothetical protein